MITSSSSSAALQRPRRSRLAGLPGRLPRPPAGPAADRWLAAGLGLAALALYLRTLLPGIGYSGDTAKWQFLGAVGGTPHPTGYPLYLALNKAFVTAVPVGSLAWRANLLSAVLGAGAVAVVCLLLRTLGARPAVAAATAATFAVTVTFWSQAVVAEVYTLHILLLAAVGLCLARWRATDDDRWLRAALVLVALSFGNHLGTALSLPGLAWVLWSGRRRAATATNLAWALGAAAAGAAQYAYLVWMTRVGEYVEQPVHDLGGIVDMVTGGRFRDEMFLFGPGELLSDRLPMLFRLARGELGVLLVVAGLGVATALRGPHRAVAVHLLALATAATAYALEFDVEDVFVFFLPLWLVATVFLGLGAEALAVRVAPHLEGRGRRRAALLVLAAVPLVMGAVNYPRASQRGNEADAGRIQRAIDTAGHDALLVTDNYADSEYIWYHLLGEGLGDERNLALGNQVNPVTVARFVRNGSGGLTRQAPRGTPVYTATAHQAVQLADAGLVVTEVAEDVWLVEAP